MKEQGKTSAPDLKNVIPYVKRKVLQGQSLVGFYYHNYFFSIYFF